MLSRSLGKNFLLCKFYFAIDNPERIKLNIYYNNNVFRRGQCLLDGTLLLSGLMEVLTAQTNGFTAVMEKLPSGLAIQNKIGNTDAWRALWYICELV